MEDQFDEGHGFITRALNTSPVGPTAEHGLREASINRLVGDTCAKPQPERVQRQNAERFSRDAQIADAPAAWTWKGSHKRKAKNTRTPHLTAGEGAKMGKKEDEGAGTDNTGDRAVAWKNSGGKKEVKTCRNKMRQA